MCSVAHFLTPFWPYSEDFLAPAMTNSDYFTRSGSPFSNLSLYTFYQFGLFRFTLKPQCPILRPYWIISVSMLTIHLWPTYVHVQTFWFHSIQFLSHSDNMLTYFCHCVNISTFVHAWVHIQTCWPILAQFYRNYGPILTPFCFCVNLWHFELVLFTLNVSDIVLAPFLSAMILYLPDPTPCLRCTILWFYGHYIICIYFSA